jgi:hypothetical protein
MGGGLLQLVAIGAQSVYLSGSPQITLFKQAYKRHTNFSREAIKCSFNGGVGFGRKMNLVVPRNGDLLSQMYLSVTITGASATGDAKWAWVKSLGHALIQNAELVIGGQRIDLQTGEWHHIWNELTLNVNQERAYNKLIGNTLQHTTLATTHDTLTLNIPLQFFFCRRLAQALPIIALQYHQIELNITFAPLEDLLITSGFTTANPGSELGIRMQDASVYADFIFLDTDERRSFAQKSHEMLIEQVQYTGLETIKDISIINLNINHCVKELIWVIHSGAFKGSKYLWYHPTDTDDMRLIASKRLALALARYDGSGNLILNNGSLVAAVGLPADLLAIFNDLAAVALSVTPTVENVSILGEPISLTTASTPVMTLLADLPSRPAAGHGSALYDVAVRMPFNFGLYIDGSINPLSRAVLQLNGHDRFSERDAAFFNYIQPLQHHTRTPADGVNVYAFAMKPEEYQPSGDLNFSRVDTANLRFVTDKRDVSLSGADIAIYALSWNVLRILSGMGGVAFSN